ncbi:hypothetical protein MAPG_11374 [Magnaporthiopsis poae ATCC 64411]|uniref:Uncharacterized protein n=1 Tax=Magnaporthiopsis poae (strain ATCC 64411 / 73-15) TaxID=644358 RepID=A0A0C4EF39_MAGP6|nr:hypothetical protein MAPG_11374 [Magnaporthiopsis poae ATCC 64411]
MLQTALCSAPKQIKVLEGRDVRGCQQLASSYTLRHRYRGICAGEGSGAAGLFPKNYFILLVGAVRACLMHATLQLSLACPGGVLHPICLALQADGARLYLKEVRMKEPPFWFFILQIKLLKCAQNTSVYYSHLMTLINASNHEH